MTDSIVTALKMLDKQPFYIVTQDDVKYERSQSSTECATFNDSEWLDLMEHDAEYLDTELHANYANWSMIHQLGFIPRNV